MYIGGAVYKQGEEPKVILEPFEEFGALDELVGIFEELDVKFEDFKMDRILSVYEKRPVFFSIGERKSEEGIITYQIWVQWLPEAITVQIDTTEQDDILLLVFATTRIF